MTFKGTAFRLSDNWFSFIDKDTSFTNYLEIGSFYGANVLSVIKNYNFQRHFCIDPYVNNEDFPEVPQDIQDQNEVYSTFLENIKGTDIKLIKDFSFNAIGKFENDFFDLIYIDGNHNKPFVLEDAVLAYRKLRIGGYLVFDDYGWRELTNKQIDYFEEIYNDRMKCVGEKDTQVFFIRVK